MHHRQKASPLQPLQLHTAILAMARFISAQSSFNQVVFSRKVATGAASMFAWSGLAAVTIGSVFGGAASTAGPTNAMSPSAIEMTVRWLLRRVLLFYIPGPRAVVDGDGFCRRKIEYFVKQMD